MEGLTLNGCVYLPKTGANEISGVVRSWFKKAGSEVGRGEPLGEIETSKAIVEIEAEAAGWFYPFTGIDDSAEVGAIIAVIADRAGADVEQLKTLAAALHPPDSAAEEAADTAEVLWTRKAELLADRHGLNHAEIAASVRPEGTRVTEEDVLAFIAARSPVEQLARASVERVLVVGSAEGGGASIVLDSLARSPHQIAVGVVDRDESMRGAVIAGVSVLGSSDPDAILAMYRSGQFDSVVLAFNRNVDSRAQAFAELRERGIPFANVIDPTVNVRNGVKIGVGNVILGSSYLGAEAEIGDNNFLSSNTCIEHHCRLGSHSAFGPAVAFSGRVTIGDRIRFGTQIAVEPEITIGSDCIIASSCVITNDVPERSVLRAKVTFTLSPRT